MRARHWEHLLSLGSNIDPDRWVPRALELARDRFDVVAVSDAYVVAAVGSAAGSPPFVNLAARVRSDLPPPAMAQACRRIEEACDRVRQPDRFAPRTLDLDVVYTLGPAPSTPHVHPELYREAYVLVPCADIWPDAVIPISEEPAAMTIGQRAEAMFPGWRAEHRRSR